MTTDNAALEAYQKEALSLSLSTKPIDRTKATEAVNLLYRTAKLDPPARVLFLDSPKQAQEYMATNHQITPRSLYQDFIFGNNDAAWVMYWAYRREVLGDTEATEDATGLIAVARECGWVMCFDELAIVCERPIEVHVDDQYRPHNTTGAAFLWKDGSGLYQVHGITIPKRFILDPSKITAQVIDNEPNSEVRRTLLELYGMDRFLLENGKMVHEDRFGQLWVREIPDDEPIVKVRLVNSTPEPDGSNKIYLQSCHPELRPLLDPTADPEGREFGEPQAFTARNAVASLSGFTGDEYAPEVET